MKIPTALLDATRSRFWRSNAPPPARIAAQPAADDADDATDLRPAESEHVPAAAISPRVPPGDALLAALDAASDDAQRAALLASASAEARDDLTGALAYREMSTLAGRNPPLGALVSALDGAAVESARAVLLAASSPALLVELAEHLRTPRDMERAYMDMMLL